MNKKIGIIGVGNMGGAIYQALSKLLPSELLYLCDKDLGKIKALHHENYSTDFNEIAEKVDISDFEYNKNISLKTIPQPILEIYKQIYNII